MKLFSSSTNEVGRTPRTQFFRPKFTCFHQCRRKKIGELWLKSAITFVPEIVAGTVIYQIEAPFELYKSGRENPANEVFSPKIYMFLSVSEEKNLRIMAEVGHSFFSRNRCWDYNIPNRSSFRALQIRRDEIWQTNFLG